MLKKILSIFLVLVFTTFGVSLSNIGAETSNISLKEFVENENDSIKMNDKLLSYFSKNYGNNSRSLGQDIEYPNYYGGSFIDDDGNLNVMLTKNIKLDDNIEKVLSNVSKIECKYSYAELSEVVDIVTIAMDNVDVKRSKGSEKSYYQDIMGSALNDEENVVEVYIKNLNDEKTEWFKNNVCDSDCILLKSSTSNATEEANTSGQKLSNDSYSFSGAFRVKRTNDSGLHYGFITCGHGNSVGSTIYGYDNKKIGTVKLHKYGGAYDMSYVEMSSKDNFSNTITGSPYTLKSTNDDISTPVVGQGAYIFATHNKNVGGKVTSTKVSFKYNNVTFSNMIGANYSSQSGDSGGLITSTPSSTNSTCKPLGVHKGTFEKYKVFTSAMNVINYWHLVRY